MMRDLVGRFAELGIPLIQIRGEALELQQLSDGHVSVITDTSLRIRADHVVLCCGNLQSREYKHLETSLGFHATPYPIRRLARSAQDKASVAVLGAHLSAIDVVLGLTGSGFDGQLVRRRMI